MDFGKVAAERTRNLCLQNGINCVGLGSNSNEASEPLIIDNGNKRIAIINCCEHEFSLANEKSWGANALDPIKQYYAIQKLKQDNYIVLVIVHAGHELFNLPSLRMVKNYHFFIDAGADIVINHHQHCFSGYEIYNEKPIFYGLGNLVFPPAGKPTEDWYKGIMIQLNIKDTVEFNIIPYTQFEDSSKFTLIPFNKIENELNKLNSIISNKELLKEKVESYYDSQSKIIARNLGVYSNRYAYSLMRRGLLPSFESKGRKLLLNNLILCESHRDKLEYYFEKSEIYK